MAGYDPCAGHECDHCWVCTHLGVCCGQVPNIKSLLSPDHFDYGAKDRTEEFKEAIQAAPALGMVELVRLDIEASIVFTPAALTEGHNHQCDSEADVVEVDSTEDEIAVSLSLSVGGMLQLPAAPNDRGFAELPPDYQDSIFAERQDNG